MREASGLGHESDLWEPWAIRLGTVVGSNEMFTAKIQHLFRIVYSEKRKYNFLQAIT